MSELGRILIVGGCLLAVIGLIIVAAARFGFRGMPGDIRYESPQVRVYFPIVTCLVLSALLTIGAMIWRWWSGR